METEPRERAAAAPAPTVQPRLARARSGDSAALRALLDGSRDRVLTLCCRLLGDHHEAEDATQEAMLKVSLHLHALTCDDQFGSWCWRIAQRICFDRLRTRHRRAELLASYRDPGAEDGERTMLLRILVRQVLADMPEEMSEVLILRDMEEQSYADIAATLGLPLGTVKSRLNAARSRFRRDYLSAVQEEGRCGARAS